MLFESIFNVPFFSESHLPYQMNGLNTSSTLDSAPPGQGSITATAPGRPRIDLKKKLVITGDFILLSIVDVYSNANVEISLQYNR